MYFWERPGSLEKRGPLKIRYEKSDDSKSLT